MSTQPKFWTPLAVGALLAAGCYNGVDIHSTVGFGGGSAASAGDTDGEGDAGDSGSGDDPAGLCGEPDAGKSDLRRLTARQYDNTVRELFGATTSYTDGFAPDERVGAFKINSLTPVGELQVEQYLDAAEAVAADVSEDLSTVMPCATQDDACAEQFIEEFAPRVYRRPLEGAEVSNLIAVYQDGKAEGGGSFENGIRLAIAAMLQSPWFLYNVEFGTGEGEVVPLGDFELASRLSYFLWNTMPDDTLFAAADGGELTGGHLGAQVDRMLADERAAEAVGNFHQAWLGVDELELVEKDTTVFPTFNAALATVMKEDTATFATAVVLEDDARVDTLLTGSFTYTTDPALLALYGVTLPAGHQPGDKIALDPNGRAGLLTQPGVLARHAHANQSSPVHRGVLVRTNFLCQTLPPPPPDVDNVPPDPDPNATTRERFAEHTEKPECASCHRLIDGIGFGLERYDGVGAYREMEGDLSVDASGEIVAADVAGEFNGGTELAALLASSEEVKTCVAQQWFRFALARVAEEHDDCAFEHINTAFAEADYDVRVLLRELVLSDAFRNRRG